MSKVNIAWNNVSGMDVIDGYLYFGLSNGNLYRSEINGAAVVSGTTEVISGPGIDGNDWDNQLLAFSSGSRLSHQVPSKRLLLEKNFVSAQVVLTRLVVGRSSTLT